MGKARSPRTKKKKAIKRKKTPLMTPTESQKIWLSVWIIGIFLMVMALCNGAITTKLGNGDFRIALYDTAGQRRMHLAVSVNRVPGIAIYSSKGDPVVQVGGL